MCWPFPWYLDTKLISSRERVFSRDLLISMLSIFSIPRHKTAKKKKKKIKKRNERRLVVNRWFRLESTARHIIIIWKCSLNKCLRYNPMAFLPSSFSSFFSFDWPIFFPVRSFPFICILCVVVVMRKLLRLLFSWSFLAFTIVLRAVCDGWMVHACRKQ